jgi:glycerol kinase
VDSSPVASRAAPFSDRGVQRLTNVADGSRLVESGRREMLALFAVLMPTMLATVVPSASNFGAVSGEVVAPLLPDVPITGVLGDQQSALFGQACFEVGMVKATYGTGAFVLANAGGERCPLVVDGLVTTVAWDLGPFGATSYALEGSAFVAGAAVQWLRDLGLHRGVSPSSRELALSVADSAGAQFVPAFTGLGSPFWRSDARGSHHRSEPRGGARSVGARAR